MKRFFRESLAIVATLIGLLGMIWSFHLQPVILAVTSLCLVAVGATVLIVRYVQSTRPEFTIRDLHKELRLNDTKGHLATFERRMIAASNVNGLREIWYRNVAADGKIENIKIDGQAPGPGDIVKQLGLTHIRRSLVEPLGKGQEIVDRVTYDLIDSFVKDSEALIHIVNHKTRKVHLTVHFPTDRSFKRARFTEMYGGVKAQTLKDLSANPDNAATLAVELEDPKLGGSYELRWEW